MPRLKPVYVSLILERGFTISCAFTIHVSAKWRFPCTSIAFKVTGLEKESKMA